MLNVDGSEGFENILEATCARFEEFLDYYFILSRFDALNLECYLILCSQMYAHKISFDYKMDVKPKAFQLCLWQVGIGVREEPLN